MDIKNEIKSFLDRSGWKPSTLAYAAGIRPHMITRILSGERKGMTMRTFEKLRPFLYSDKPQQQASGE
jgi:plasmid maintenance system antidote protein VapI